MVSGPISVMTATFRHINGTMEMEQTAVFSIGQEVVRTKGDYVVGKVGTIVAIDGNRAQVSWKNNTTTKVSFGSLALTSTPYEIKEGSITKDRYGFTKVTNPKYIKL
jgi:hypothetical protein